MSEEEIRELVLRRYSAAQSPFGLWRLNFYVRWKRVSWRCFVAGTAALKRVFDLVISFTLLILFLPIFAALAIFVGYVSIPAAILFGYGRHYVKSFPPISARVPAVAEGGSH